MVQAGTGIRCDGVAEYCYEWNNVRVFGKDAWWDISAPGNALMHRLPGVGTAEDREGVAPAIQAQYHLTWCGNIEPT